MPNQTNNEKVYLSKTIRFIVQQQVGVGKLLSELGEKYKIKNFRGEDETIVLVEEKDEEDEEE